MPWTLEWRMTGDDDAVIPELDSMEGQECTDECARIKVGQGLD